MNKFRFRIVLLQVSVLICAVSLLYGQEISNSNPGLDTNHGVGFLNSIMNPDSYTLNQSVTVSALSGGGISGSVGVFSNYLNYQFNDKLKFKVGLHLIKPSFSNMPGQYQKADFNYDLQLNYKFSDNMRFQLNLVKINPNYFSPRYSRPGYLNY